MIQYIDETDTEFHFQIIENNVILEKGTYGKNGQSWEEAKAAIQARLDAPAPFDFKTTQKYSDFLTALQSGYESPYLSNLKSEPVRMALVPFRNRAGREIDPAARLRDLYIVLTNESGINNLNVVRDFDNNIIEMSVSEFRIFFQEYAGKHLQIEEIFRQFEAATNQADVDNIDIQI